VKRSLVYERVLEHIKEKLADGTLQAGDRLWTIASLAEQLGVSQAAVREAYRVLELMGVLEITQGRGTFVAPSYHGGIDEIQVVEQETFQLVTEARKLVEPELAAMAAERATSAEITRLIELAREMESLYQSGNDFIEPDITFHEEIYRAAGNQILLRMFNSIKDQLLDSRRISSRLEGATEKAIAYHQLIARSIQERKPEVARSLMRQHIEDVERSWHTSQALASHEFKQKMEVIKPAI
jgi:GntR family transcriptional repressor for pyruvate dehydrogenase complex